MRFATGSDRGGAGQGREGWPRRWPAARRLGRILVLCCLAAVACATLPWTRIERLASDGDILGPIGARTSAGFTCLMTSIMTALLVLSEGSSAAAREAVRTACMMLTGIAALALLWRWWEGPGPLRGVASEHTTWFFVAAIAIAAALSCSRLRLPRRPLAEPQ